MRLTPLSEGFVGATTHFVVNKNRVFEQKFIPKYALFLEISC